MAKRILKLCSFDCSRINFSSLPPMAVPVPQAVSFVSAGCCLLMFGILLQKWISVFVTNNNYSMLLTLVNRVTSTTNTVALLPKIDKNSYKDEFLLWYVYKINEIILNTK